MLLCSVLAFAQRTVTGTVVDEKGQPIPFATVTQTGTRNATQADPNGAFSIRIPQNARLTISAAGHTAQTVTPTGTTVNVTLTTTETALSEVVVTTAFGIKRSQRVTPYSSQVVGDQQLNIIPERTLNEALAGKVAGVQFRGQSAMNLNNQGSLRIRGGQSLSGDVSPLYVVDGTPSGSFDINPDDVQDITVLKGANATALFGDAAVNGAIVITTKKAAAGRTTIELNEGITFDKVYILPKYQNLYAGGASASLIKFNWQPGMPNAWKPLDGKYYPDYTDDASWGPRMVGQEYVPWYAWNPNDPESGTTARLVAQPDNIRDFYNTGVSNITNVAFSRGGQNFNVRVSYTNQSVKGMIPNSSSYRNTLFTSLSFDLNTHFTVSSNLTYSNQRINGQFSDAYSNQSSGSFNSWFHRDLDLTKLKQYRDTKTPIGTYMSWNLAANPSSGNTDKVWRGNYWYNFFTYFDLINNTQKRDYLTGNASLSYKLNNNFKIVGSVRSNLTNNLYEYIVPSEIENSAVQTGELASYSTGNLKRSNYQFDAIASYNQGFLNNKLNLNLNAGASDNRYNYYTQQMATKNGLNVPGLYAIANSKDQPTLTNTRERYENRALFASGDLEWNRMIDATFAVRNDWYSVLPASNNRLFSPSAGLSFFFSDFTRNALPWLSYGKVFGSWGKKPTSGLNPYQTNFTYGINQNKWGTNFLTTTPDATIDPKIHGVVITTYETGLDLKFFNNRYGLNVVYYNETSKNPPLSLNISGYSGFTSYLTNLSEVKRSGIEVIANARIMSKKNFTWDVTKTFSYLLTNPVVQTDTASSKIQVSSGAFFSGIVPPKVYQVAGMRWGQLIGTAIKRNADGIPVVNTTTGAYVTEPNHDFGSVVPRITGGLVNNLTFKGITLNFSIDYQFGGKFFSLSEMWGTYSGLLAPTAATNDKGWNVRDDVSIGGGVHVVGVSPADLKTPVDKYVDAQTYFHGLGGGNAIADPFIHGLSFVKLREISLGYNLPVTDWHMGWVKGINASITARNPVLLYRETKNFDPSEISGVFGEDGQFPGTRGVGFNLKFNF